MGKRGPKPTPSAVLNARGSWRGKSRAGAVVSTAAPVLPAVPEWLSPAARAVWELVVPAMAADVLAAADVNALARYCDAHARWQAVAAVLDRDGTTFTVNSRNGTYVRPRPELAMYHKLAAALVKLETEFGLTPASRGRVAPPENGGGGDPGMEKFFPRLST